MMGARVAIAVLAAGLSCLSAIVEAEPPIGSRLGERLEKTKPFDEATSIKQGHALATCLVNKRTNLAKRLLNQTTDNEYRAVYKSLTVGGVDCERMFDAAPTSFSEERTLQVPPDIFRGLLAEELIGRAPEAYAALPVMPRQLTYSRAWYGASGRDSSVNEMATCVSEVAPVQVLALTKSEPYSDAEGAAFGPLIQHMGVCLRAGVKLTGNRQSLRAALADALYERVANPAPDSAAPPAKAK